MVVIEELIYLTSAYPLARAWLANRNTTLVHALSWTVAAWLGWFGATLFADLPSGTAAHYLALCLTGCAGIAVLGARRPIVGAWNFVLLGLFGVLLLPLAENTVLGTPLLDPLRLLFALATVTLGVLNYLPTRFGLAALMVGAASVLELVLLLGRPEDAQLRELLAHVVRWLVPLAGWAALAAARRNWETLAEFDRLWLLFRDRFGLMWSQRIREQFNRAATAAGWPVHLRWRGLRKTSRLVALPADDQAAIVETLREMLKRFEPN